MPRRWHEYRFYVDGRLVETTTDYTLAMDLYRIAARQVPQHHQDVRVVGVRGTDRRTLVRKPRFPSAGSGLPP
ncbi:MAG: hypothetical protein K6V97_11360 [Actinomycetia bacterium]|nr:hypothetical protein [Actinomycetes bacterium]